MPAENVHTLDGAVIGLDSFPTPGHASHHVCYLDPDGTLYAGDACGVRVLPGRSVMPPTPPPDVDIAAWQKTFDEIARREPERLALIHFGVAEDVKRHLEELELRLLDWAESVAGGATEEEFVEYALAELADSGEDAGTFTQAMPLWQSYRGLARWAEKRARAVIAELERAEAEAFASLMSAAGLPVTRVAGAVCFAAPGIPDIQLNRVAGLGLERDPSDEELDEIEAFFRGHGNRFAISLTPGALHDRLLARGYTAGYAWMKFRRAASPAPGRSRPS